MILVGNAADHWLSQRSWWSLVYLECSAREQAFLERSGLTQLGLVVENPTRGRSFMGPPKCVRLEPK